MSAFLRGLGWLAVITVLGLGGCDEASVKDEDEPSIKITGTSGEEVSLDGTWEEPCDGDSEGTVVIAGSSISIDFSDWITEYECTGTPDFTGEAGFTISYDQAVTITDWLDDSGASAAPPAGLEEVTEANGMTIVLESDSLTPVTAAGAEAANEIEYCGFTDWTVGESKNILDCFLTDQNGDPVPAEQQESWVLDDSGETLALYSSENSVDTTVVDGDGYPTEIINSEPLLK